MRVGTDACRQSQVVDPDFDPLSIWRAGHWRRSFSRTRSKASVTAQIAEPEPITIATIESRIQR